jgi:hypothetical protein
MSQLSVLIWFAILQLGSIRQPITLANGFSFGF